jgi:hypothetical protein
MSSNAKLSLKRGLTTALLGLPHYHRVTKILEIVHGIRQNRRSFVNYIRLALSACHPISTKTPVHRPKNKRSIKGKSKGFRKRTVRNGVVSSVQISEPRE